MIIRIAAHTPYCKLNHNQLKILSIWVAVGQDIESVVLLMEGLFSLAKCQGFPERIPNHHCARRACCSFAWLTPPSMYEEVHEWVDGRQRCKVL